VLEFSSSESTEWVGQLEWPQEVGSLLEVWSSGEDLVDQILDGDDSVFSEVFLNEGVVGERDSLSMDLSVTSLVDEFSNGLQVWLSVGNVWLNQLKHLGGSLGELDEDSVVDLE